MKPKRRFSPSIIFFVFILISPILFFGCGVRLIKDKMDTGKKLLAEMDSITQDFQDQTNPQDKETITEIVTSDHQVKGETFTDIFDMLDYEEVICTLSDDGKTITVINPEYEIPLRNNYILPGKTLIAGTGGFSISYNPEENQVTEYIIRKAQTE